MIRNISIIYPNLEPELFWGAGATVFGDCYIAWIGDKICFLGFEDEERIIADLRSIFPHTQVSRDNDGAKNLINEIFAGQIFNLGVVGTEFQVKIWRSLLDVPEGRTLAYQEFALKVCGSIAHTRAAALAVARNNISYLIPCHRIVSKSGALHNYRWGCSVKRKLLEFEGAQIS